MLSGMQRFHSFIPFSCNHLQQQEDWKELTRNYIQSRGPDSFQTKRYSLSFQKTLELEASVLSLRGSQVTKQPLEDSFGNVLLFNGEIYDDKFQDINDTCLLSQLLGQLVVGHNKSGRDSLKPLFTEILSLMDSLSGPWSFVYFISSLRCLIFGRDIIGRRSLLFGKTRDDDSVFICSVSPQEAACSGCLIELAPLGLYFIEWEDEGKDCYSFCKLDCHFRDSRKIDIGSSSSLLPLGAPNHDVFLDSYLPDKWWRKHDLTPSMEDSSYHHPSSTIHQWIDVLFQAVHRRIQMLQLPLSSHYPTCSLPFALLFSGGIDSLLLAYLIWKACQLNENYQHKTLDLINVCFGPPSKSPDRKTAIEGLEELNRICSNGNNTAPFRLLCVDVEQEEYQKCRQHLKYLLCPCWTPMDLSIGSTLWFGARAKGYVKETNDKDNTPYTSPCRVLFSGLGADELLGGYKKRHRNAFQQGGYASLAMELNMDLSRLWWRNLGRDDRIVGDHGKELRLPFLDEHVIDFVTSLPLQVICDLELPDGVGDKRILRQAVEELGFSKVFVSRKKRAMQFGSRSKTYCQDKSLYRI